MKTVEARLELNQISANNRPDYDQVHAAMADIGFLRQWLGLRLLPGMYRCSTRYSTLIEAREEIERAIRPLGFRFHIQVIEVAGELDFQLEPAGSFFEAMFDNPYGSLRKIGADHSWERTPPVGEPGALLKAFAAAYDKVK